MKKFLIAFAIVLALFIIASFGYSRARVPAPVQPVNGGNNASAAPVVNTGANNAAAQDVQSDEQGGIEVSIEKVERAGGQTKIFIAFNNHVYDLSSLDLAKATSLNGKKPLAYNVDDSQVGGHHVQGELVFAGEERGTLVLPVINNITFNFVIR